MIEHDLHSEISTRRRMYQKNKYTKFFTNVKEFIQIMFNTVSSVLEEIRHNYWYIVEIILFVLFGAFILYIATNFSVVLSFFLLIILFGLYTTIIRKQNRRS